jgi:hypothetical protein
MSKKPAALSADLIAPKGAAKPPTDMPTRSSAMPDQEPSGITRGGEGEGGLMPLNFRVSAAFRREFKTYAAQHDLKLNELLRLSFHAYRQQQGQ